MSEKRSWPLPLVGKVVLALARGGIAGFILGNVLRMFLWRNGWGWLDGLLPSSVPREVPFVALGAVFGAVVELIKAQRKHVQGASLSEFASSLGMNYEPSTTPSQLSLTFPDWQSGAHWYHGDYRGVPSGVVDVTEVRESSDSEGKTSRSTTERTVVLLPREGLPDFELGPRSLVGQWLSRRLKELGLAGMEFDATAATTQSDVEAIRRFVRSWYLDDMAVALGAGASGSVKADANESAVRRLFTPRVMTALEPFTGWSVQANEDRLLLWRGKGFAGAANRVGLLNDAIAIRETLLAGLKSAPIAGLPAPAGATASERSRKFAACYGRIVAGAFLGFAVGGACGMGLISNLIQAQNRLSPLVTFPLFFACPILGLVAGGILGYLFAAHRAERLASRDNQGAISDPLAVPAPELDRRTAEPVMGQSSQGRSIILLLVGGGFLGAGLFTGYRGVSELSGGFRSSSWLSTSGVIHRSDVKVISGAPGESPRYHPKVSFSYRVGQTNYQSERIRFGGVPEFASRADAEGRVAAYPAGEAATVFYDPGEPAEAVLERGTSARLWFQPVFSALFAFLGFCVCGAWLRWPSRNRHSDGPRTAAPGLLSTDSTS